MKALIQRVSEAEVMIESERYGGIGNGLLVFLGIEKGDGGKDIEYMAKKIPSLRIFEDDNRKMNRSVKDIAGEVLVVSQFTLAADCRRGNRPSFDTAEEPEAANMKYLALVDKLKESGIAVATGRFAASMEIRLVNNGPVTILLDSRRP